MTDTTSRDIAARSATVTIGGSEYELVLTTKAIRLIAQRYGGLDNLGAALETSEDLDQTLTEVIWLITLLANQSVQIHNLPHRGHLRPQLTEGEVELLTVPADIADSRGAIAEALQRGPRRDILTEPAPKASPAADG